MRPVAGAEQRERHQRDRGDRRHPVDAHGDLEGELLQSDALLVGAGRRARIRAAQGLGQRERLAESDVDVPVAAAQPAHHAEEPAEALARLRAAPLLGGVVAHVGDLVVGDRYRDQEDVLALGAPVGVDHVGEQSEARRQQLAGARAAALDVPLEREALLDQVIDVVVQHELVDLVVAEAAPDEEGPAAPHQRADREEVHVDAAGGVVGGVAVLVQRVLEHEMVEVRLVRGEEHHGMSAARAPSPPGADRGRSRAAARSPACRAGGSARRPGRSRAGCGWRRSRADPATPRASRSPACARASPPGAGCRRGTTADPGCPREAGAAPCSGRRAASARRARARAPPGGR